MIQRSKKRTIKIIRFNFVINELCIPKHTEGIDRITSYGK